MAARPCKGTANIVEDEGPTAYELQREERIRQNRAKMGASMPVAVALTVTIS